MKIEIARTVNAAAVLWLLTGCAAEAEPLRFKVTPLGVDGESLGINNAGTVAVTGAGDQGGFIADGKRVTRIATAASARAINDAGQVTGNAKNGQPFIWKNGSLQHLSGAAAVPYDINAEGVAAGGVNSDAVIWRRGVPVKIAPGARFSVANGINNAGVVVGGIDDEFGRSEAFFWTEATGLLTLGHLPGSSGLNDTFALDVNDL